MKKTWRQYLGAVIFGLFLLFLIATCASILVESSAVVFQALLDDNKSSAGNSRSPAGISSSTNVISRTYVADSICFYYHSSIFSVEPVGKQLRVTCVCEPDWRMRGNIDQNIFAKYPRYIWKEVYEVKNQKMTLIGCYHGKFIPDPRCTELMKYNDEIHWDYSVLREKKPYEK